VAVDTSDLTFDPHTGLDYDDSTDLDGLLLDDPTQHDIPETSLADHMMQAVVPPRLPEDRPPTRLERRSVTGRPDTKPMQPALRPVFGPDDTTDRDALEIDRADTVLPVLEIIAEKKRSRWLLVVLLLMVALSAVNLCYLQGWIDLPSLR
jgi:hypothetical protein